MKNQAETIYTLLLHAYQYQGWWPVTSGLSQEEALVSRGYKPGLYAFSSTASQRLEIILGAILTQNTTWKNVEVVISALKKHKLLDITALLALDPRELAAMIRPSGYYNQKAKKIGIVLEYFVATDHLRKGTAPQRAELLSLWGIGQETADSILLYAFNQPCFVIDAYTIRLFLRLGIFKEPVSYEQAQNYFYHHLPRDHKLYNEYHALIVRHVKEHCHKRSPLCQGCALSTLCQGRQG